MKSEYSKFNGQLHIPHNMKCYMSRNNIEVDKPIKYNVLERMYYPLMADNLSSFLSNEINPFIGVIVLIRQAILS